MKQKIRHWILSYCVGCYIAFALFFTLSPLWWPREIWGQLGHTVPIYGLLAPLSIPMLAVAPIAIAPGPGIHAVIFWLVCLVSLVGTFLWLPRRLARTPRPAH